MCWPPSPSGKVPANGASTVQFCETSVIVSASSSIVQVPVAFTASPPSEPANVQSLTSKLGERRNSIVPVVSVVCPPSQFNENNDDVSQTCPVMRYAPLKQGTLPSPLRRCETPGL